MLAEWEVAIKVLTGELLLCIRCKGVPNWVYPSYEEQIKQFGRKCLTPGHLCFVCGSIGWTNKPAELPAGYITAKRRKVFSS
jgi:hypothetical protein